MPSGVTVVSVRKGLRVEVPDGNTRLVAGDVLTVFARAGGYEQLVLRLNAGNTEELAAISGDDARFFDLEIPLGSVADGRLIREIADPGRLHDRVGPARAGGDRARWQHPAGLRRRGDGVCPPGVPPAARRAPQTASAGRQRPLSHRPGLVSSPVRDRSIVRQWSRDRTGRWIGPASSGDPRPPLGSSLRQRRDSLEEDTTRSADPPTARRLRRHPPHRDAGRGHGFRHRLQLGSLLSPVSATATSSTSSAGRCSLRLPK